LDTGLLIFTCLAWLVGVVGVGLDFAGHSKRRKPGTRWMGLGLVLMMGGIVVLEFASYRDWPFPEQHRIAAVVMLLAALAFAGFVAGIAVNARAPSVTHGNDADAT
jgi:hypothetical protein